MIKNNVRLLLLSAFFIFISGCFSYSLTDLPEFSDFSIQKSYQEMPHDIDLKSHPEAYKYRTLLKEGIKKGANFADHYIIVSHGCGTDCYVHWIIDVGTGKVITRVNSELGASYQLKSALLILNPPEFLWKGAHDDTVKWLQTHFIKTYFFII